MNKDYTIGELTFNLSNEGNTVFVKSITKNARLGFQTIENVYQLIDTNIKIVYNHYNSQLQNAKKIFPLFDLYELSFSIVIHYLYMYNMWRFTYKKQENKDLTFDVKDFDHPSTHDIIFFYLKKKYPTDWQTISAALIGMTLIELKTYYKGREDFYNK
jgi:hypothetical protein